MEFGAIVEPISRALWEDDLAEYPASKELEYQWNGRISVPTTIHKLVIAESSRILQLFQKCILTDAELICGITEVAVNVYKLGDSLYVITYKAKENVVTGKITEKLMPWLNAANYIYVLTSSCITLFQNISTTESSCIIRSLSTETSKNIPYLALEVPNLVTGLSASVFSYSVHNKLKCTLYIAFFEEVPLDSLNTDPLLNLLSFLGIKIYTKYKSENLSIINNLYM